jgi:hypothetical protein
VFWVPCFVTPVRPGSTGNRNKYGVDVFLDDVVNHKINSFLYFQSSLSFKTSSTMATDFEEGTIIPNLALSVVIRPVIDEVCVSLLLMHLSESRTKALTLCSLCY